MSDHIITPERAETYARTSLLLRGCIVSPPPNASLVRPRSSGYVILEVCTQFLDPEGATWTDELVLNQQAGLIWIRFSTPLPTSRADEVQSYLNPPYQWRVYSSLVPMARASFYARMVRDWHKFPKQLLAPWDDTGQNLFLQWELEACNDCEPDDPRIISSCRTLAIWLADQQHYLRNTNLVCALETCRTRLNGFLENPR